MIFGVVAIVLGAMAISEIKKSQGRLTGEGLAIAGIVIGVLDILGHVFIFIIFMLPRFMGGQFHGF